MHSAATFLRRSFFIILLCLSPCYANSPVPPASAMAPVAKAAPNPLCPKPLLVGWTGYAPFQITVDHGKAPPSGLEMDLLKAIGEKIGCRFAYQETPAARQIGDLKQNNIQLLFSPQKTDQTSEYAYFSHPYRKMSIHLVVRKGEEAKYNLTTLEDLKNSSFVIGVKQGIYYGPEFEKLVTEKWFQSHIEFNVTSTMNIKKLAYGRLDALFLEPSVERELTKKLNVSSLLSVHPFTVYSGSVYILFSKKSVTPALVDVFNVALDAMEKNGEIKALMTKYNVEQ